MNFSNTQIHSDTLPQFEEVVLKPISKQYFKIIILNKILIYGVLFLVLFLVKWYVHKALIQDNFWYLLIILLVFCGFNFIIALLSFKKRKYAIREKDVIYAKGLFVSSITTVPIYRIQHIEEYRGFLSRQLNLATLNIFTAGESGSDLSIKGLPYKKAKQINDFLSAKVNGNN